MRKKQRQGALSAFICATSFIIGLSLILIIAPDFNNGPDERLQTLTNYSATMQLWYFLVYVVFGAFLLVLSIALLEPEQREHSPLEQVTTLASYLWACYIFASGLIAIFSIEFLFANHFEIAGDVTALWQDIYAVQMGLGEGIEWVGAIWVILVNTCIYIENRFNRYIVYFGYLISVFGLMTLDKSWQEIGAVFGLLQIIWFVWVGTLLLKENRNLN